MLEIIVDPRRTFNLRQAVTESIESGDYDNLYDDIRDCFTEDQVEQIEEMLENGDISEAIDEIVNEWNAEDVDDLFEAIETFFADQTVEIQFIHDDDFEEDPAEKDLDVFDDVDDVDDADEEDTETTELDVDDDMVESY